MQNEVLAYLVNQLTE